MFIVYGVLAAAWGWLCYQNSQDLLPLQVSLHPAGRWIQLIYFLSIICQGLLGCWSLRWWRIGVRYCYPFQFTYSDECYV